MEPSPTEDFQFQNQTDKLYLIADKRLLTRCHFQYIAS